MVSLTWRCIKGVVTQFPSVWELAGHWVESLEFQEPETCDVWRRCATPAACRFGEEFAAESEVRPQDEPPTS
jgi:hypothetical protein